MKYDNVDSVIKLLKTNGWVLVRTKGDHHIFNKDGAPRPIVVPGNGKDALCKGTLYSILRAAGLK